MLYKEVDKEHTNNIFIDVYVTKNEPKMEGVLVGLNDDSSPTNYKPLLDNISRKN